MYKFLAYTFAMVAYLMLVTYWILAWITHKWNKRR